jgi:integrase
MKQRFRLYRRSNGGRFYLHDNVTGKQESLGTTDRTEATRLLHARNEASRQPLINVQIARAYLAANDAQVGTRNWQTAMNEITKTKQGTTHEFYVRAFKQTAFDSIRALPIVQTRPEHFMHVLEVGTIATNKNLRRLHNFALAMTWLPWPVLIKEQWPELHYGDKRGVTREEHQTIVAKEKNPEWKAFLELLWHVGAAQGDLAALRAEDVDVEHRVISFSRQKTRSLTVQRYGEEVAAILHRLPKHGPLFPKLSQQTSSNRAARFAKALKRRGVVGVSLHSYRYAWAERAKTSGYPERFAQEALGHKSKAVHRAYAKMARVELPPLEEYERRRAEEKVIALPAPNDTAAVDPRQSSVV